MNPVYKWMISRKDHGVPDGKIIMNFQKFRTVKNGEQVKSLSLITGAQKRRY